MAAPARDLKSDSATHSRKQDQQKPIIVAPAATDDASDPELRRARTRSRSPVVPRQDPNSPSIEAGPPLSATSGAAVGGPSSATRRRPDAYNAFPQPVQRDHLSPSSALGMGTAYWRGLSRSPSPLGLIPIHREWRHFVHKHEIPRKALHVSVGFLVLFLYLRGYHVIDAAPGLFMFLVPIALTDFVRMRYPPLNRFYIRCLGAFMREAEAHDKYNGVISYMAGVLFVAVATPADVAVMSVICLSWCDTAASTIGRLYGRYTPRVRKGKSLAGSLAAFSVGVVVAFLFWGVIANHVPPEWNTGKHAFAFNGRLTVPAPVQRFFVLSRPSDPGMTIDGIPALILISLWSGFVVSVSEAIDLWGFDDNLTIPVLYGAALSASLRVCT